MGLFSSVIHVRDASPDSVSNALAQVVPQWPFSFSEKRAMTAAPKATDRESLLYCVSPTHGRWVAVLEAHFAVKNAPWLPELAKPLSAALGTYTLALMVHDDDVLYYNFFHKGADLDGYNSNPQYFERERLSDESIAEQRHNPRQFAPIVPE